MRALVDVSTRLFDVLLHPTVPILAPPIADLETDEAFFATNGLLLRNTLIGNLLDRPIVSLPMNAPDESGSEAGMGLSIVGEMGADAALLDIAEGIEDGARRAAGTGQSAAQPDAALGVRSCGVVAVDH